MPTAILIDGAFFIKRFRKIEPHNMLNARRAVDLAFRIYSRARSAWKSLKNRTYSRLAVRRA